eukprot:814840-Amphidinium_carterae.1
MKYSATELVKVLHHDPPYHAVLGPSPKIDCLETATLTAVAKILQASAYHVQGKCHCNFT